MWAAGPCRGTGGKAEGSVQEQTGEGLGEAKAHQGLRVSGPPTTSASFLTTPKEAFLATKVLLQTASTRQAAWINPIHWGPKNSL